MPYLARREGPFVVEAARVMARPEAAGRFATSGNGTTVCGAMTTSYAENSRAEEPDHVERSRCGRSNGPAILAYFPTLGMTEGSSDLRAGETLSEESTLSTVGERLSQSFAF
jgi:hypothetical protein